MSRKPRRSQSWFGRLDRDGFIYRSWTKNRGDPARPVRRPAGDRHLQHVVGADAVQRALPRRSPSRCAGVLEAGGFPLEFPVMSLGETLMRPTTMLFRNLVSMDVEESIRANPLDGVVLLMGCDKTTPALLMGAASVDLPTIGVSGGPMLSGKFRGGESARAPACGR
jgi:L-arabonate dehydrase